MIRDFSVSDSGKMGPFEYLRIWPRILNIQHHEYLKCLVYDRYSANFANLSNYKELVSFIFDLFVKRFAYLADCVEGDDSRYLLGSKLSLPEERVGPFAAGCNAPLLI